MQRLSKKENNKEDKIKEIINQRNNICNNWKFQLQWNKLEWVEPNTHNRKNNPF